MNCLLQISIILTVLSLGESTDNAESLITRKEDRSLCFSCHGIYGRTICGSDGKNYQGLCELIRARCRSRKNIKFVKRGKCPTCQAKDPVRCIVPACFRPSCPAYPKAICMSFCACQSEYYYRGRKVNCYTSTPTNPCNFKFCGSQGICKVVKGRAVCVSKGAVCSLPKVVGPCRGRFPRYFFNSVTQQCELFYYGGCRGNRNNFQRKELCEKTCKPDQDVCSLPAVQGPCKARFPRYFYNATSSKCEKFYYGGCLGNKNNFRTIQECTRKCRRSGNPCDLVFCGINGRCKVVNGKPICISSDVCSLPKEVGRCKARIPRYYYNTTTRNCEEFYYGGCGGNQNNFKTFPQCSGKCPPKDVCSLPAVQGPCEAHIPRYFYNATSSKCERFYYGGCLGNKNNFRTIQECTRKCGNLDICLLPRVTGPCRARIPRYFYNNATKRCEGFIYGGCRGNKNNFRTQKECEKQCRSSQDPCAQVRCSANNTCRVILGTARCIPTLANPCIATLCMAGTRCVVANGQGKCIPIKPNVHPLCAAVSCQRGTRCIVRNGRPLCVTSCRALNRCSQQGSFCDINSGICKCRRFCRHVYRPVCGSDGRRYSGKCQLDAAACRQRKSITRVPCYNRG